MSQKSTKKSAGKTNRRNSRTDAVKVAVRVRPFATREITTGSRLIVEMDGNTTRITDPANLTAPPKAFTFDYSYWSHNGYDEDAEGVLVPDTADSNYASQDQVFQDLGAGVVDNAFAGYNSAVFAYGQTGSGKSYSMVGYGPNRGLIPQTCEALFERVHINTDPAVHYQVQPLL